jgi:multiple sugar transport system permease protein
VVFLAPAGLVVLLVTLYPLAYALYTSLFQTEFLERTRFVGLANYGAIVLTPSGQNAIVRSVLFVSGSLVLAIPIGLLLALLLNEPRPGRALFRILIMLPWVVSELVTALLWKWLATPNAGPLSYAFQQLFGPGVDILGPTAALPTLIVANVWRTYALPTVLFLAALQGIPREVIEQTEIDGATGARRLLSVILPLMRSTVAVAVIMLSIYYVNVVTLPLILTGGGPVGLTQVLPLSLFNEAFQNFRLGTASAIAMILFGCNFVLSLAYFRVFRPFADNA